MPISPRLDRRLYRRISDLVNSASRFIFMGTYSINVDYGIVDKVIRKKQVNQDLMVCCLLPPPTDFVLWDPILRRQFMQAYGLQYGSPAFELSEAISVNPQPAFNILERIWTQGHSRGQRRLRYRSVLDHIHAIASLYSAGIVTLLEPNTHAKFVVCESNIYEGSGNLTRYGLEVNVEVYNFYPDKYPGIYSYAFRSYRDFLLDYLARLIQWKLGENYLRNAQQLGNTVSNLISSLGIRFNPKISREKIVHILENRIKLSSLRSSIWMLPGHIGISRADFMLSQSYNVLGGVLGELLAYQEKEVEKEIIERLHKEIEICTALLSLAKETISKFKDPEEEMAVYEKKYNEAMVKAAEVFLEFLQKKE